MGLPPFFFGDIEPSVLVCVADGETRREMLSVIVIAKALIAVAGLALLGQGIVHVLAGAGRETNIFYRLLRILAKPATTAVRAITPRRLVPDEYIGFAAFFLLAGIYIALVIQQASLCVDDVGHPACERLAVEYQQRCAQGQAEACDRLQRGGLAPARQPTGAAPQR